MRRYMYLLYTQLRYFQSFAIAYIYRLGYNDRVNATKEEVHRMVIIVFDLEFNQSLIGYRKSDRLSCPFEIIQIGAVKLDQDLNTLASFSRYVKPTIHPIVNPRVMEITGITDEMLASEKPFSQVYSEFLDFISDTDAVFCTWGKADMKELFRNIRYYELEEQKVPKRYINLQTYASVHFKLSKKQLLRLQYTVEALEIPLLFPFHNALHDAYYTAEILKKIYLPEFQPKVYNPDAQKKSDSLRHPKKIIDFDALFAQFEKMYQRTLSEEEKELVRLAYQMGKTHQFIKESKVNE